MTRAPNKSKRPRKPATAADRAGRTRMAVAAGAVGAIAAGVTAALKLGWLDRFFTVTDADPGAEHAAPDLAPAAATPGTAPCHVPRERSVSRCRDSSPASSNRQTQTA